LFELMLAGFFARQPRIVYFNCMQINSSYRLLVRSLLSALILFCTACSTVNETVPQQQDQSAQKPTTHHLFADHGRFGIAPPMADETALFELSAEQRADFLRFMNDPRFSEQPKYKRLYDYLEQYTYNFNYRGQTYLAQQAMENLQGNCLSLAIMTTALAREVDVRVAYQLIDTTPVFEVGDNAVAKGVHVRSKLYRTEVAKSSCRVPAGL